MFHIIIAHFFAASEGQVDDIEAREREGGAEDCASNDIRREVVVVDNAACGNPRCNECRRRTESELQQKHEGSQSTRLSDGVRAFDAHHVIDKERREEQAGEGFARVAAREGADSVVVRLEAAKALIEVEITSVVVMRPLVADIHLERGRDERRTCEREQHTRRSPQCRSKASLVLSWRREERAQYDDNERQHIREKDEHRKWHSRMLLIFLIEPQVSHELRSIFHEQSWNLPLRLSSLRLDDGRHSKHHEHNTQCHNSIQPRHGIGSPITPPTRPCSSSSSFSHCTQHLSTQCSSFLTLSLSLTLTHTLTQSVIHTSIHLYTALMYIAPRASPSRSLALSLLLDFE